MFCWSDRKAKKNLLQNNVIKKSFFKKALSAQVINKAESFARFVFSSIPVSFHTHNNKQFSSHKKKLSSLL